MPNDALAAPPLPKPASTVPAAGAACAPASASAIAAASAGTSGLRRLTTAARRPGES